MMQTVPSDLPVYTTEAFDDEQSENTFNFEEEEEAKSSQQT